MTPLSDDILHLLPLEIIQQHRIVPLAAQGEILQVGVIEKPGAPLLRDLAFLTGKTIVPVELEASEVEALLDTYLSTMTSEGNRGIEALRPTPRPARVERPAGGASVVPRGPVVQLVNHLIQQAIEQEASDIHIEPYEMSFRVRYRLDGVLHVIADLSLFQRDAITSRLKIMADLDIAEKRRPQDGRIRYRHGDRTIDLRVSTLPTDFGEKVVLRILDKSHLRLDLDILGFDEADLKVFRRAIHQPYGIILVSGPTGSGKTTTLYAALNEINTDAVNITTIEDPIEYNLPGINQTHVRADIGLTFAKALRSFLRQDPNIIMVGEIRDRETAEIAIRASLTGHLVISTIHTNDAASTISRLVDMGVEPFLVASSLRMTVAQRLVRQICVACKEEVLPDPALLEELQLGATAFPFYQGRGCEQCAGTGYKSRIALFEAMPISETMADLITQRTTTYALRNQARAEGLPSLRAAGLAKIKAGITTPEEVLRETSL